MKTTIKDRWDSFVTHKIGNPLWFVKWFLFYFTIISTVAWVYGIWCLGAKFLGLFR